MNAVVTRKYFGTDGIRGRVGTFPIIPDFILKLGWAVGCVLANGHNSKVIIGKDTRISGYMFESALEAGLSAAGVDIYLLGPMPTPAVAYLTQALQAQVGVVISASHNPFYDNGIKFFENDGKKLGDHIELAIEAQLKRPMTCVDCDKLGKAMRIDDAPRRYLAFCKASVSATLTLKGLKIVVDCANGANYHIGPTILRELGAKVVELASNPDGLNINKNCGATDLLMLCQAVRMQQADLGIAFDGDGDRVMMVDHCGQIVDGDELLFIIAYHLHQTKALQGGVIGTVMTNVGMELALKNVGIKFVRTRVGDRYILAELLTRGWLLGGESSGHIIHLGLSTTGDGIISALQVLTAIVTSKKSLHQLKLGMHKLPQVLINLTVHNAVDFCQDSRVKKLLKAAQKQMLSGGRVLVRPSGTEPVVRVMVEGENKTMVTHFAVELANSIKKLASHYSC